MNVAKLYPIPDRSFTQDGLYIGVDGCRGGWTAAVLDHGDLRLESYESINSLIERYPSFDAFLIDMAIGLRNRPDQVRPDDAARKELGAKGSSVFPIPSRESVYSNGEEAQKKANLRTLGKSLAKQSIAIIPKIREVDEFLNGHPEYKNRILESHPEVDFARLNGSVLMSRKKEEPGPYERISILSEFLGKEELSGIYGKAKELKCNQDDLIDAICLAVTGALYTHGQCETIPEKPEPDENGLLMQLTVPKKRSR
jgi:predicted RNase H-like nuclease